MIVFCLHRIECKELRKLNESLTNEIKDLRKVIEESKTAKGVIKRLERSLKAANYTATEAKGRNAELNTQISSLQSEMTVM